MKYAEIFRKATRGEFAPYPYQEKFAEGAALPALLRVPTGAGKTEAAALGWLYRRFEHPNRSVRDATPRRLVYCLPMRTLVEQTVERIEGWIDNLGMADKVGAVTLMGGEPPKQWYLYPEKPFIIVGTQDMLLSRALNRGYGNSPFMWPVEYGLLNNDCLWVMDEVQLMANGLPTSTQLAGLRNKLRTYGPAHSLWMSATVQVQWLATADHLEPSSSQVMELGQDDMTSPGLRKRHNACKMVSEISIDNKNQYPRTMAELIKGRHKPGTLTLAIVNTVERAQEVYRELNNTSRISLDAEKFLVHSRFRALDRAKIQGAITSEVDASGSGMIVVATQAVEAGVDISARTLITELAPWSSLVQRFGRCNRTGEDEQGDVVWVDVGERNQDTTPYDPEDVAPVRQRMKALEGKSVGPSDLEVLTNNFRNIEHSTVIRRRDLVGLFDTTPDLSGSYLDVSQYVRGTDERNVSVYWRDVAGEGPTEDERRPQHYETVSVPIGGTREAPKGIKEYLDGGGKAWRWDFLDSRWQEIRSGDIHPGMTLLLAADLGGYSLEVGWDVSSKERVEPVRPVPDTEQPPEDGLGSELTNTGRNWVLLCDHSRHVEDEAEAMLRELAAGLMVEPEVREAITTAALYHDVGKAHSAFQDMLRQRLPEGAYSLSEDDVMAKSPGNGRFNNDRRHFRHELGSALAILEHLSELDDRTQDLAAYLAAAHHGKVRLGIRSLPGKGGRNPEPDHLLGYQVSEAETLPAVDLGEGLRIEETKLDLSIARIGLDGDGRRSWLDRTTALLDWLGPFRLACLEAIVRAADRRASREEEQEDAK